MTSPQRFAALAAAVLIAAAGLVVLRPDDDATEVARNQAPAQAELGDASQTRVRLLDGRPDGGVATVTVKSGQQVRITVVADSPHELHLHGYDIPRDAAPGRPARFSFVADIEGIFELESHTSEEQVVRLLVEPE